METRCCKLNSKSATSCNTSKSLTRPISDGNNNNNNNNNNAVAQSIDESYIDVDILQDNLCDNNENVITDKNSRLLLSTPVNNHTLTKESTEATINANLEMLLNTLHNLKNNDITLINKSVTDYNDRNIWCNGTILIATDSMFNNIDETRLSENKNIKVNCFGGAEIKEMYG